MVSARQRRQRAAAPNKSSTSTFDLIWYVKTTLSIRFSLFSLKKSMALCVMNDKAQNI